MADSSSEGQAHPKGVVGFMTTVPGILTALATLVTAITGLIIAVNGGVPGTGGDGGGNTQGQTLAPAPTATIATANIGAGKDVTTTVGDGGPIVLPPTATSAPVFAPTATPAPVQTAVDISGRWNSREGYYLFVTGSDPFYDFTEYNAFDVITAEGTIERTGPNSYYLEGFNYFASGFYGGNLELAGGQLQGFIQDAFGGSVFVSLFR